MCGLFFAKTRANRQRACVLRAQGNFSSPLGIEMSGVLSRPVEFFVGYTQRASKELYTIRRVWHTSNKERNPEKDVLTKGGGVKCTG